MDIPGRHGGLGELDLCAVFLLVYLEGDFRIVTARPRLKSPLLHYPLVGDLCVSDKDSDVTVKS